MVQEDMRSRIVGLVQSRDGKGKRSYHEQMGENIHAMFGGKRERR